MAIVLPDGTLGKTCSVCGLSKPLGEFHPHRFADGYANRCKGCSTRKASITNRTVHTEQGGVLGKSCSVCREWKPLGEYHKDVSHSDGLGYRCKVCARAHARGYWEADPIAWGARNKACYHEHRESRHARARDYRAENLDEIRAKDRERGTARYAANPYARAAYTHARRAREKAADGRFTPAEWRSLCARYDHTCLACGRKVPEIKLSPDHVIPLAQGGSNGIENIQPLCLTCNLSKAKKTIDYRPR